MLSRIYSLYIYQIEMLERKIYNFMQKIEVFRFVFNI